MLSYNQYTIIPQIRFTLTYDTGVKRIVTVKNNDNITCTYLKDGVRTVTTGNVTKIGCNFNSSLGAVGTTAYIQLDASSTYSGTIIYVQPSQVVDIIINSTSGVSENIVCSVDSDNQRVTLVRENEVGAFQYSLDGITWKAAVGAQGKSAYECAVDLGYVGTEEEWLASLKGETGETGGVEVYKVYNSVAAAELDRINVPHGKLVTIIIDNSPLLYIRNNNCHNGTVCTSLSTCTCTSYSTDNTPVIGYRYTGVLTAGPKGDKGDGGKSAYQYAVEGGYPGTETDFYTALAKSGKSAVGEYTGLSENTLVCCTNGAFIDFQIFGATDSNFISKTISSLAISDPTGTVGSQTLTFTEDILLRAVPVVNASSNPNLTIDSISYVADSITSLKGVIGVSRRVAYIESYNGETISGEWISSTGTLSIGAKVQYVTDETFTALPDLIQLKYRSLYTYTGSTSISISQSTYIHLLYGISLTDYIVKYMNDHKEDIIAPVVESQLTTRMGDIPSGVTVSQYIANKILEVTGVVPTGQTLIGLINALTITVNDIITNKIGELPEGKSVVQLINAYDSRISTNTANISTLNTKVGTLNGLTVAEYIDYMLKNPEEYTTTERVGGIVAGTKITTDDNIFDIVKQILSPEVPEPKSKIYYGLAAGIPTSLEGLTVELVDYSTIVSKDISYTSDNFRFVFAYNNTSLGELVSIKDPNGIEQSEGWSHFVYSDGNYNYYIYYTNERLTVSDFNITFVFRK